MSLSGARRSGAAAAVGAWGWVRLGWAPPDGGVRALEGAALGARGLQPEGRSGRARGGRGAAAERARAVLHHQLLLGAPRAGGGRRRRERRGPGRDPEEALPVAAGGARAMRPHRRGEAGGGVGSGAAASGSGGRFPSSRAERAAPMGSQASAARVRTRRFWRGGAAAVWPRSPPALSGARSRTARGARTGPRCPLSSGGAKTMRATRSSSAGSDGDRRSAGSGAGWAVLGCSDPSAKHRGGPWSGPSEWAKVTAALRGRRGSCSGVPCSALQPREPSEHIRGARQSRWLGEIPQFYNEGVFVELWASEDFLCVTSYKNLKVAFAAFLMIFSHAVVSITSVLTVHIFSIN